MNTLKPIIAVAVIRYGHVFFKEDRKNKRTIIQADLKGLSPNRKYAWHIHEAGDLRDGQCKNACAHYNPFHKQHGGLRDRERHVGDLGNLTTDHLGNSKTKITTNTVKLNGRYSVIGRSLVLHEKEDDLGRGGTEDSLTTGSAGARIACGVIGYAAESRLYF